MNDPAIDRAMRAVLAQLELVSAVPAANLNSSTPGTDESKGGGRPPGDYGYHVYARWYGPPFHEMTKEHAGCRDDRERETCLQAAQRELTHLRKGQHVEEHRIEKPEQTRRRMLKETETWSLSDIARSHWRTSPSIMRRLRVADGRDAETGVPIDDSTPEVAQDLASRAKHMKTSGMSLRQIGMALGVDKQQVQRFLKRVA